MKILLIGGTGTISGGMAEEAVKRGYDVTLLNRGHSDFRCPKGAQVIHCDINNTQQARECLAGKQYDVIIDPITYNVNSLKNKINLFASHCKTYMFISSTAAIGNNDGVQDEYSDKNPKWSYGINKLDCEKYLQTAKLPFNYIIIRPSITYGDIRIPIPVACRKNPYTVIDRIINDRPLICFEYTGEHESYHKLMDIRDFSVYAVEVLGKEYAINNDYIICADQAYSWEEAYSLLYEKLNAQEHVYQVNGEVFKYLNPSLYDDFLYDKGSKQSLFSKEKIKKDTQIELDEIPLQKGIEHLVDYLQKNFSSKPLEKDYNLMTDAALMYDVKDKDEFLTNYIKTLPITYLAEVKAFYKNCKRKKNILYRALRKMKSIIKKIIK